MSTRAPRSARLTSAALIAALTSSGCGDDAVQATTDTDSDSDASASTAASTTSSSSGAASTAPTSGESDSQSTGTATSTTTHDETTTAATTAVDTDDPTADTDSDTDATTSIDTDTDTDTDSDTDATTGDIELCPAPMEVDGGYVHFGGPSTEYTLGFAVDAEAARWSGGYFFGAINLDPQGNAPKSQVGSGGNMWLSKIDAAGQLEFGTTWPGIDGYHSYVWSVAVDEQGAAYIVGHFVGAIDFDPGPGVDTHISSGGGGPLDAFMMKFSAAGQYQWGITWGGPNNVTAFDVARDPADGALFVTGYFSGAADLDPGPGQALATASGPGNGTDGYLLKLDADGGYLWSKTWGAGGVIYSYDLALAGGGGIAVTGTVTDTPDLDPGPGEHFYSTKGPGDSFLMRFHADGEWAWGIGLGGDGWDLANDLAIDSHGDIYLMGGFTSPTVDFDPGPDSAVLTNLGGYDGFLARYLDDGTLVSAQHFGTAAHDNLWGIAIDCEDNVTIGGQFSADIDLDPGEAVAAHSSKGGSDAFVVHLGADGLYKWSSTWGGPDFDQVTAIAVRPDRMLDIAGNFEGTADLQPGAGQTLVDSKGESDAFFVTLRPSTGLW